MCYDLSFSASIESIYQYLPEIRRSGQLDIHFDSTYHRIAQGYPKWPIVINNGGELQLRKFEWGIIPPYMKTPDEVKKGRKWMVNARAEKLVEAKTYWNRIRSRRCLIPATGFFEHREVKGWKSKVPYYIKVKGRDIFFIAGLWGYSHIPDVETGELPGTFTVITRSANQVMSQIHNGGDNAGRMPLILPVEMEREWLNPSLTDVDISRIISYSIMSDELDFWPVASVRKVHPDDDTVIERVEYPGEPSIEY